MRRLALLLTLWAPATFANNANPGDYLLKVKPEAMQLTIASMEQKGAKVEVLSPDGWLHVQATKKSHITMQTFSTNASILHAQPNYKLGIRNTVNLPSEQTAQSIVRLAQLHPEDFSDLFNQPPPDNPPIPAPSEESGTGADPLFGNQWGMHDIGVETAWQKTKGDPNIIVAVIDTGVDYTHEDLASNIWHNPGEIGTDAQGRDKSNNGIDDDANGYVDDVIGWDWYSNDNKPFDNSLSKFQILQNALQQKGGNPGHGTHCAGNIAARSDNGKGIAGVAPHVKIMPLRFISENDEGTTASAVKAIQYATKMGAKVMSNSWGGEGEDPSEAADNKALRDAIKAAGDAGVMFVAAAGNGHGNAGNGYDNDTDPKPGYPASYDIPNIVSVAAIDSKDTLAPFSNYGVRTVHVAAPGVKVFSSVPGSKYEDTLIPQIPGLTQADVTWDGTSMATPHVAGAAALYWSLHPTATVQQVKDAIIKSAKPTPSLQGKIMSGGRLDVGALLTQF